jgi:hypothetical protein
MRILSAPFGAVALALGLFVADAHQAVAQCCGNHSCRSGGVNNLPGGSLGAVNLPTQMATSYPMRYPMIPYSPQMPGYYPTVPAYPSSGLQAPTSSSTSATSSVKSSSGNVLPTPSGSAEKNDASQVPAEVPVRLRYWELSVSGLQGAADKERLTAALDTMKGSRGATVKVKPGDPATIKVWYSDKEPIEADAVMQAVTNLGFTGKVVGG